ncbi:MAG: 2-oxoglutarate dehydrogenase complex dihydrolipoyllysine-residue succinyltransferase [Planctomycetota bacterium]
MATDIVIPGLGESITEAVIAGWLVEEGAYVDRDQDLVELETDKVTMPLPSPAAGTITFSVGEGDTVEVGAVIGSIDESAEKPADAPAPASESKPEPEPTPAPKPASDAESKSKPASPPKPAAQPALAASASSTLATTRARRVAQDLHVDIAQVTPTGATGQVLEQDVLDWVAQHPAGTSSNGSASSNGTVSREPRCERMTQLRKSIAARLVEAQHNAAMLTTFNECDMTNVMALRSRHKDAFLDKHGVKLGFMSFFVKACVSAAQNVPSVNAFIVQGEKGLEIEYHDYVDIAVAVGTDKGLVVPVLRNCQSRSFSDVESGILELAKKARDGQLTLEDMQGGTFTISNGGVYGSMLSTPILNPPQSGILGMHNIIKRPVEHPDKPGEAAIRPMMYLALSYDHRIVDGQGAVTYLKHVKECIEDPERLLLEV